MAASLRAPVSITSRSAALRPLRASVTAGRRAVLRVAVSASAADTKVYYFNARGRAEATRLLLVDAGIEFEDVRFEANAEGEPMFPMKSFEEFKARGISITKQAPLLEMDGMFMVQSQAMNQYIARKCGFYGGSDQEMYQIDMVNECARDLGTAYGQALFSKDEVKMANFWDTTFPRWMGTLDELLGEGEYYVGGKFSLADLAVYAMMEAMALSPAAGAKYSELAAAYPRLLAHYGRVAARPNIAAYLATRPESAM